MPANILQSAVSWASPDARDDGLVTRMFRVEASGRVVPAVLWTSTALPRPAPLVLMGHGGSQHKASPDMTARAARLVLQHGFAVASIDGPVHGERRDVLAVGPERQAEFLAMWRQDTRIDAMVGDWQAAIDALLALGEFDAARIGWHGVSMGTAYGLPLLAREPRIAAAVLGMWGTSYPNSERLATAAPRVRCPVLFQQKWDDELFTRESQIALFDALGSGQKWLKIYPGRHAVGAELLDDAAHFLVRELASST